MYICIALVYEGFSGIALCICHWLLQSSSSDSGGPTRVDNGAVQIISVTEVLLSVPEDTTVEQLMKLHLCSK